VQQGSDRKIQRAQRKRAVGKGKPPIVEHSGLQTECHHRVAEHEGAVNVTSQLRRLP
jgi:hypothetical protein